MVIVELELVQLGAVETKFQVATFTPNQKDHEGKHAREERDQGNFPPGFASNFH